MTLVDEVFIKGFDCGQLSCLGGPSVLQIRADEKQKLVDVFGADALDKFKVNILDIHLFQLLGSRCGQAQPLCGAHVAEKGAQVEEIFFHGQLGAVLNAALVARKINQDRGQGGAVDLAAGLRQHCDTSFLLTIIQNLFAKEKRNVKKTRFVLQAGAKSAIIYRHM